MLMEPSPTQYDLRFNLLGVPVRVHPMFWLVSVLMGLSALREGVLFLVVWIACVFVSILVHEFGHVCMGQIFGTRGSIVLYGFGGLAIGSNALAERWKRVLVSFAGPLAGFVLLGVLFAVLFFADTGTFSHGVLIVTLDLGLPLDIIDAMPLAEARPNPWLLAALGDLVFINLMWGLVNLLPVWPLDGGMISREICESAAPDRGMVWSLGISLVVAGLLAAHCFMVAAGRRLLPISIGGTYAAILFLMLALQSFQLLQQAQSQDHDREPWA